MIQRDKAGRHYWDSMYIGGGSGPTPFGTDLNGLRNHSRRQWAELFSKLGKPERRKLIEVGCGGSAFLPFLASAGFSVSGLDYSEAGCESARRAMGRQPADIRCMDVFRAELEFREVFDVVISFGVLEHFTDTAGALRSFAALARPGGLLLTTVPNMHGAPGYLHALNPVLFEKHVAIDTVAMQRAHSEAGLKVLECDYFQGINFGVVNLIGSSPAILPVRRAGMAALKAATALAWIWERSIKPIRPRRSLSPFVFCLAAK